MATRFRTQFPTMLGEEYRVDIDDSAYAGSVIEIDTQEPGFALSYDGQTDSVNPGIVGSRASINIYAHPGNRTQINSFISDVVSSTADESRFTVAIYKISAGPTTSLYWCGYLSPDLGQEEDRGDAYFLTIKAVDGLARLKNVDYANAGSPYGNIEFLDHIYNALSEVGNKGYWGASDVWLRTIVNWTESGMPALAAANDPLAFARVSGEVFATSKNTTTDAGWKFFSCYKTLEQICLHWSARLMLSNGSWRFEQVRERMEENFYERRYDDTGALLSSTNAAGYDTPVVQTGSAHRLSGGAFSFLPALKSVTANYQHRTYLNYVALQSYRWQKNSGYSTQTYTVNDIAFDSDSFFRVSGKIYFDCSTTYSSLANRWHLVFGILLRLPDNPYRLRSMVTLKAPTGSPTSPAWTIQRETPTWTATDSGYYYEVSSLQAYNIFTSSKAKGVIEFSFQTPVVPSGAKSFSINYASLIRGEYVDGSPATLTFTDWRVSDVVVTIAGVDNAANFEQERIYKSNNTNAGNSDAIEIDNIFGHAVKPWTPTKIQVSNDGVTWVDSTATWDRGADTNEDQFGGLLTRQMMALQQTPVEVYTGSLHVAGLNAHSRVVFPDDSTWLINRAEFRANENTWAVEMMKTGIADGADIDADTPIGIPGPIDIDPFNPFGLVSAPSNGTGTATYQGSLDKTLLGVFTANVTDADIPSGTVTSIPLNYAAQGGIFNDNDVITIMHPQNGNIYTFIVNGTVTAGATSITVDSTTINETLPEGSVIFYPFHNITTQDTGNVPIGGGSGDILNGGNTTGATVAIGTNDANALELETNNVTRLAITGGASTGGAVTITNVTANTSTVQDILTLRTNSAGTAAAGFGGGILFQGESSTTDNQDMARIAAQWTTATHASREAKVSIQLGDNAGALTEIANFNVSGNAAGQLSIGSVNPVTIENNGITHTGSFTIGNSAQTVTIGGSSGSVSISSSGTSASAISITTSANAGSSVSGIRLQNLNYTQTSLERNLINVTASFLPTSGTAVHNQLAFTGTINQTGGANGITRGIHLNHTLTAVADFRAIDIAANHASAKGVYQSGASTVNNFAGATAFGTTSAPDVSAIVDIVSTAKGLGLPAMTTAQVNAIGSPRDGLFVYDTDTDTAKLRANGAWVSLGTGSGTITGSGTSGQIAYFTGMSAIGSESNLNWDATNNRMGVNKTSPAVSLDIQTSNNTDGIRIQSDGTVDQDIWGIEMVGTATGPYVQRGRIALDVFSNAGASPKGQSIVFRVDTDGESNAGTMTYYEDQLIVNNSSSFNIANNTGRLRFQATSAGIFNTDNNWLLTNSSYTTNDTAARLKLVGIGTTSSNYGLKVHDGGNTAYFYARDDKRIGIGVDPADAKVQIKGDGTSTNKTLLVEDSSGTDNFYIQDNGVTIGRSLGCVSGVPTIAFGTAAGTGPTEDFTTGGNNGFFITFTTGTAPATNSTIFTATLTKSFPNGCSATFAPGSDNAVGIWQNCKISGTANNSITFAYVGTLAASTTYSFWFTIIGY